MEPRPPRPRTPPPAYPAGGGPGAGRSPAPHSGYAPGPLDAPYAPPAGAPGYPPIPGAPMGGEAPLLSRQERRRQRVARGLLAFVATLAVLVALGFALRDRLPLGATDPTDPTGLVPAAQVTESPTPVRPVVGSLGSPEATLVAAEPTAAAAANLIATATPTPPPPTPAPQPTPPPADAAAEPAPGDAAAENGAADAIVPLAELLPAEDDLPAGLAPVAPPADRSFDEVAGQLGDPEEAGALLRDWGWEGNTFQDFSAAGEAAPGATTFINVSIHRFADPESAEDALTFFSDLVVTGQGLEEVEVEPIGDSVRALRGAPEDVTLVVLYVRDGSVLYRLGGSSNTADGDPTADVVALAQTIVDG